MGHPNRLWLELLPQTFSFNSPRAWKANNRAPQLQQSRWLPCNCWTLRLHCLIPAVQNPIIASRTCQVRWAAPAGCATVIPGPLQSHRTSPAKLAYCQDKCMWNWNRQQMCLTPFPATVTRPSMMAGHATAKRLLMLPVVFETRLRCFAIANSNINHSCTSPNVLASIISLQQRRHCKGRLSSHDVGAI